MDKKLYDRRPGESARAYQGFKAYCDLGPARSIRKAVRTLGKNKTTLEQWSTRWDWVERSRAWDADAEQRVRDAEAKAMKAEAEKWAKRQIALRDEAYDLGDELIKKAKAMLAYPISKQTVQQDGKTIIVNPTKFSLGAAAKFVEVGEKLRRLAAGVSTENLQHTGPDNQPLPVATGQVVILELPPGRIADDQKQDE
jgi:hypothetical protein